MAAGEWALVAGLSHLSVRVLMILEQLHRPSRTQIARCAGCEPKSVDRAISELVQAGALIVTKARGRLNAYELVPPMGLATPMGLDTHGTSPTSVPSSRPTKRRLVPSAPRPLARARDSEENLKPSNRANALFGDPPENEPVENRKPRAREPIWDTLVDLIGASPAGLERGRWNAAVKSLKESGATPDSLHRAAATYRSHPSFAECVMTPTALAANWTILTGTNGHVAAPRAKVTGWRLVRGSHSSTLIPDPAGTDAPPR